MNDREFSKYTLKDNVKSQDLETLQAELLVYITDDINRLSKLHQNENVQKKIYALSYFENKIKPTASIMDLIELANEILVHPDITKNRISSYNITTVEKSVINFLHAIYEKFSIINTLNKKNEVGHHGILLFTDQVQITNVLNNYIDQYEQDHKGCVLPLFNQRQMAISQDKLIVMFDLA